MTDLDLFEVLLLIARWIHAIGVVTWIGGSILFAFVLRPVGALEPDGMRSVMPHISRYYRELVALSIVAIVFSALILTLDRLSDHSATGSSVVVLVLHLCLSSVCLLPLVRLRPRAV